MTSTLDETIRRAVVAGPDRAAQGIVIAGSSRDGTKQFVNTYGSTTLEDTAPVTPDTVMWLASCTKLVTAIAVMQCVEKDLFALDSEADVKRLLPEFAEPDIISVTGQGEDQKIHLAKASRTFTLRELLTHSSGLSYDALSFDKLVPWRISRGESFKWLCGDINEGYLMPLIFEPGTSFMYGPGYDWAGRMVERATGLQLGAYLDQHIFTPLAISTLHFFPSKRPDLQGRLMPEVAHHSPEKPLENGPIFWAAHEVKEDCIGGAGLYGTPADFLKILTALLKNDGTLLKPASVDTLLSGHSSPSAQAEFKRLTTENRDRRAEWSPGLEDTLDWNYGFGGNVLQSEAPGKLSKGSAMWVGVANLVWIIDREAGYASIFATQVHPMGEARLDQLKSDWLQQVRAYFT